MDGGDVAPVVAAGEMKEVEEEEEEEAAPPREEVPVRKSGRARKPPGWLSSMCTMEKSSKGSGPGRARGGLTEEEAAVFRRGDSLR